MLKRLVSLAMNQPLFVLLLTVLFAGAGVFAFRALPIEAFPDVTDVQVTVITLVPGHAPEEVEKQVTIPLEISLSGLPHSVRMFSHTQFGLSYIILTFDDQVNDYFARQQVLERLQGADLPAGLQPQLAPLSTPIGEIYRYRLRGDHSSPAELRSIEDWTVERYLRLTPGVADITSFGGFIKQYVVNLNPVRMKSHGVSMQQVVTALGRGNANAGGSYLEQGEQQFIVRGIGLLRSADDIGGIVVAQHGGVPVLVQDIGDVAVDAVPRQGIVGQDDDDEAVTGIVLMRKGENPSEVLKAVKERVADAQWLDPAAWRAAGAVLRPHLADRHDARDGLQEPPRGRRARDDRVVCLSGQLSGRRHCRGDDSAGAALDVHRPDHSRHSGQPALARRHGFRHHRRRRRHRRRERVPPARRDRRARTIRTCAARRSWTPPSRSGGRRCSRC